MRFLYCSHEAWWHSGWIALLPHNSWSDPDLGCGVGVVGVGVVAALEEVNVLYKYKYKFGHW